MTREMTTYYAQRASEYDRIYEYPHWLSDVAKLKEMIPGFFKSRTVLEVACGTGYWLPYVAKHARRVHATDINDETLAVARARMAGSPSVTFERRDAYAPVVGGRFTGGLAGFWMSHVDLARMAEFLKAFHAPMESGAAILMFDQHRKHEADRPATRFGNSCNRYEMRTLSSGTQFEIIKNILTEEALRGWANEYGRDVEYREIENFWVLSYVVR